MFPSLDKVFYATACGVVARVYVGVNMNWVSKVKGFVGA